MRDNEIKKACGVVCGDNRFELIKKYKQMLFEQTNIETANDQVAVIDGILFRFWQMGWLDKLEEYERQKAEIERLKKAIKVQDIMIEQQDYKLKSTKSEAIKEFAERLKGYAKELKIGDNIYLQVVGIGRIDNLVKEMVGE